MDNKELNVLAEKAIGGDSDAFGRLYEYYRDSLLKFIMKQGATREDAVSEAFTEAYIHIGELREPAYFSTWLHRIAKNCYIKTAKKNSQNLRVIYDGYDDGSERSNDSVDLAAHDYDAETEDSLMLPQDYAENEEIKQMLAETIQSMKEEFRSSLYLFYYEDMSISEIAEREGVSEGTVKSRLHYAKKKLREKLEPLAKSGGLFAMVPFGTVFHAIDVSGDMGVKGAAISAGGASAGAGAGASTGAGASAGAAANAGAGAVLSTVGAKISAGIAAAVLTGVIITGVNLIPDKLKKDDSMSVESMGDVSITRNVTVTDDSDASEEDVVFSQTTTTASPQEEQTSGTTRRTRASTTRGSVSGTGGSGGTTRVTTQNNGGGTQPAGQGTQPQQTQPTQQDETVQQSNIVASGYAGNNGDNVKWELDNQGVLTFKGSGETKIDYYQTEYINIATSKYDSQGKYYSNGVKKIIIEEGITSIGESCFASCYDITDVSIPNTVTNIGNGAFLSCQSLKNITLPDSVKSIGEYAFQDCSSLESFTIPKGVTDIKERLFAYCMSLKSVSLPEGLLSIDRAAFVDCHLLEQGNIPSSVKSIGREAFSSCSKLQSSITIPIGVTKIEPHTFMSCSSIKKIVIPESVKEIGEWAFFYCSALEEISLPVGLKTLESGAFEGCLKANIKIDSRNNNFIVQNGMIYNKDKSYLYSAPNVKGKVVVPESVTDIQERAFSDNTNLTEVVLPSNLTDINSFLFDGCSSLSKVTIKDKVESINSFAFCDCNSLKEITIPENVKNIDYAVFGETIRKDLTIKCKKGSYAEKYAKENNINYELI